MKSQKIKRRKIYNLVSLLVLFCSVLLTLMVISTSMVRSRTSNREKAQTFADSIVNNLVANFKIYSSMSNVWKSLLINNCGEIENFEKLSAVMKQSQPGIDSIYLAPKGIISDIYPLTEENEEDLNFNFFENPDTRRAAESAITYKTYIIYSSDSFSDNEGKFMYCDPVFIKNSKTNEEEFWGFSIVIVKLSSIIDTSKIQEFLSQGYECRIFHRDYLNGGYETVFKSSTATSDDAVQVKIPYLSSDWTMEIYPTKGGWASISLFLVEFISGIVVCALITISTYLFLYLQDKEKILTRFSYTDTLTGLGNSRSFLYYLDYLQKNGKPYAVLYMDLNDFKPVNDNYGHNTGDQVLTIVGKKLENCIRSVDSAYRIGGDEYAIIVEGFLNHHVYDSLIERIRESIARPVVLSESVVVKVGISIGYAVSSEKSKENPDSIVKQAEQLMYKDKKESKTGR